MRVVGDFSEFHDAQFMGIRIIENEVIELEFLKVNGERTILTLHGVTRMRAQDFREGNVVLDVHLSKVSRTARPLVEDLLGADDPTVSKVLDHAIQDGLLILEVNPSYGCSLLALCSRVETGAVSLRKQ